MTMVHKLGSRPEESARIGNSALVLVGYEDRIGRSAELLLVSFEAGGIAHLNVLRYRPSS